MEEFKASIGYRVRLFLAKNKKQVTETKEELANMLRISESTGKGQLLCSVVTFHFFLEIPHSPSTAPQHPRQGPSCVHPHTVFFLTLEPDWAWETKQGCCAAC